MSKRPGKLLYESMYPAYDSLPESRKKELDNVARGLVESYAGEVQYVFSKAIADAYPATTAQLREIMNIKGEAES